MKSINNFVHTYSSKPLLYGTRDAIVVATITVMILVIMAFIYYFAIGNLKYMTTGPYLQSVGKSFLTSLILGFVYEYGGINARFSAESMRYAKGSTLSKYQTRNGALVAEIAADQYRKEVEREIKENPACMIKMDKINENIDKCNAMIKSTRELKLISQMFNSPDDAIMEKLKARYQTHLTIDDIKHLKNLDPDDPANNLSRLNAVPRLVELFGMNTELVKYFIRNGFSKLKTSNGTVDVQQLSADTGVKIISAGIFAKTGRTDTAGIGSVDIGSVDTADTVDTGSVDTVDTVDTASTDKLENAAN